MNKPDSHQIKQTIENSQDDTTGSQQATSPLQASRGQPEARVEPSSMNFPVKLHLMLSMPQYSDIICWLPHGRSWSILDQVRFKLDILPIFFQHGRMSAFIRLMQKWGFHSISRDNGLPTYYHELFLRDAPQLCHKMLRLTKKELANRQASDRKPPPLVDGMNTFAKPTQALVSTPMTPVQYKAYLEQKLLTCSHVVKSLFLQSELSRLETSKSYVMHQMQSLLISDLCNGPDAHQNNPRQDVPCPSGTWTVTEAIQKVQKLAADQQQQQVQDNASLANGSNPPQTGNMQTPLRNHLSTSLLTPAGMTSASTQMEPWIRRATLEVIMSELQSRASFQR